MTDPSEPAVLELVDAVIAQAHEIAALDSARAEAWASDVLALAAESEVAHATLFDALVAHGGEAAAVALTALSGLVDGVPVAPWPGPPPSWAAAVGTSRCEGAWTLRAGGEESLVFRFVDANDEHHVVTVDLVAGPVETIGEVLVGPGDLLDALREDDAEISTVDGDVSTLASRCLAALAATERPSWSAVVNGRLLIRRLAALGRIEVAPPVFVDEDVPEPPERDPEDDAHALAILERAVPRSDSPLPDDVELEIAGLVVPRDLAPLTPAQRDAVLILEWADWLGAVIGLVRAGPGCVVDGSVMVDLVNRCPEVTTTIPKHDRARIEWAFDIVIEPWSALGVLADGRLTELGAAALPAALYRAWSPA